MTRSGSGRASALLRQRADAQHRALAAVLRVLDAHEGIGRASDRVTVRPMLPPPASSSRRRSPAATFLPPAADGWPAFSPPAKALAGSPGWGQSGLEGAGRPMAVAVALFGLDAAASSAAVDQIAARQRQTMSFVPVFLTDVGALGVFRRQGYCVELFPAAVYGGKDDLRAFQERFTLVWRKWGIGSLIDLSAPGFLRPRIRGLGFTEARPERDEEVRNWERPMPRAQRVPSPDRAALKAEYAAKGLDREPHTFACYRIIGNDLYPRHEQGQSVRNVRFILDHEPPLPGCEKRWIVNRIVDAAQEAAILGLLQDAGQPFIHIPFDWDDYADVPWDLEGFPQSDFLVAERQAAMGPRLRLRAEARSRRMKANYALNNNGARNVALRDGRARAKWVLPWDGNCFLSASAWQELVEAVTAEPYLKYFMVPMARLTDNQALFHAGFAPQANEEPQVLFRRDAAEEFDERYPYGRRPKVELFWRLGMPGSWDVSRDDVWDLPRPSHSEEAGQFGRAGWVARLSSGMAELEASSKISQAGRELARNTAIVATLDDLDATVMRRRFDRHRLTAYDETVLDGLAGAPATSLRGGWLARLRQEATQALSRGPYSVVDKSTLPPSGDRHDYWHPAPYWWPNPATLDGLPYVRRDGERLPGTLLYEPGSDQYDRTRLQRLLDDTTILALAWRATGEAAFAAHGARLLRHWFVEPASRMTPHLRFAQVRPGHEELEVRGWGIIEMKDLYFFLDAARLLEQSGALDEADSRAFRDWLTAYLSWLRYSPQGTAERRSRNNHGTAYDLQIGAIAAYLADVPLLLSTFRSSSARLLDQLDADGSQPAELGRTQAAHYTCFNLQLWANLASLAARCGCDLWRVAGPDGRSLSRAFEWLIPLLAKCEWPFAQSEPFEYDRRLPLHLAWQARIGGAMPGVDPAAIPPLGTMSPLYFPHYGIKPFWLLDHDEPGSSRDSF